MTKDLCPNNSLVWWFIASGLGLFVHSLEVLAFALSKAQGGRFYDGLRCIIMGKPNCVCVCVCVNGSQQLWLIPPLVIQI